MLPCLQPQGGPPPVAPGPPPSVEGDHQRCFESMLICTHGLNITRWPLHGFGRHVVQTYKHLLAPEVQAASGTESVVRAGVHQASTVDGIIVLNVIFQKRLGDTRQILNLQELLQRCNEYRHTTAVGKRFGFKCWEVSGQGSRQACQMGGAMESRLTSACRTSMSGPCCVHGGASTPLVSAAVGADRHSGQAAVLSFRCPPMVLRCLKVPSTGGALVSKARARLELHRLRSQT